METANSLFTVDPVTPRRHHVPLYTFSKTLIAIEFLTVAAVYLLLATGVWDDNRDFERTKWIEFHFMLVVSEISVVIMETEHWSDQQVTVFSIFSAAVTLSDSILLGHVANVFGNNSESAEHWEQAIIVCVMLLLNLRRLILWHQNKTTTTSKRAVIGKGGQPVKWADPGK